MTTAYERLIASEDADIANAVAWDQWRERQETFAKEELACFDALQNRRKDAEETLAKVRQMRLERGWGHPGDPPTPTRQDSKANVAYAERLYVHGWQPGDPVHHRFMEVRVLGAATTSLRRVDRYERDEIEVDVDPVMARRGPRPVLLDGERCEWMVGSQVPFIVQGRL